MDDTTVKWHLLRTLTRDRERRHADPHNYPDPNDPEQDRAIEQLTEELEGLTPPWHNPHPASSPPCASS